VDFAGFAALLSVIGAVIATIWSIVKDRARLPTLERVAAVVKELPAETAQRKILEDMRDLYAFNLGLAYLKPRYVGWLVAAWSLIVLGTIPLVAGFLYGDAETALPFLLFGTVLLSSGYMVMGTRSAFRRIWEREMRGSRLTDIEPDSPFAPRPTKSADEKWNDFRDASYGLLPFGSWYRERISSTAPKPVENCGPGNERPDSQTST